MATTQLPRGFASATHPVGTGLIHTDTDGLEAEQLAIPSGDFALPAYCARPAREGRFPLVLVIQEIFGVHEHIQDVCRRLAKEGYCAIAPELYARQGDVSKLADIQEIIREVVSKVPDSQVMADLDATVKFAEQRGLGDTSRLGITGFCWGGRAVWLYAAHRPDLKAGAAWYGVLVPGGYRGGPLRPEQPVDVAGRVQGAILGLYGGRDESIPPETIDRMRQLLQDAGKDKNCQIIVYPEAGHAFYADYRPSYHEASAKDAWRKMLDWFSEYL